MSDPILPDSTQPDPQPESASEPAPKRRRPGRKWIVSIAAVLVLVLILGGAAYGAHAKGDAKAKDYAKALDAWNDQKNDLLATPAQSNSGLWDFGKATSKTSLARQKVACKKVLTLRKTAAKDAAAVPKAPDSFFKILSSDERQAIKDSVAREKAVKAYATAADKVLVQLHKDCVWNIRTNSVKLADSGSKKVVAQADELLLKPGARVGNYYCPSSSKASCFPASVADRTKFVGLLLKALKLEKSYVMKKYFTAGQCESTSYGDLCSAMKATLASYYGNFGDYSDVIKSVAPTNAKLKQEYEQMKKGNKAAGKKFKEALFKAYPDFKSDFRLSKYPFWQEAYFDASADQAISKLDKLRKGVLSGSREHRLTGCSGRALGPRSALTGTSSARWSGRTRRSARRGP